MKREIIAGMLSVMKKNIVREKVSLINTLNNLLCDIEHYVPDVCLYVDMNYDWVKSIQLCYIESKWFSILKVVHTLRTTDIAHSSPADINLFSALLVQNSCKEKINKVETQLIFHVRKMEIWKKNSALASLNQS